MTTTPTSGAADLPEALRSIQRFEVVDCIDDKHVPAVIPKPHGPWVRYEDHIAALAAGQATAPQGVAYAALPEPLSKRPSEANTLVWVADPISSTGVRGVFVDDITCLWWWGAGLIFQKEVDAAALALRMRSAIASHGQAPAGAGMGHTDGGRNMFYEGRFDGESQREQQARLRWANDMRAAFERHTGNGWFDKDWRTETGLWSSAWHACLAAQPTTTAQAADSVTAPAPPPECETEAEKRAFAFGWFKALESERMKADSAQEDAARYRWLREGNDAKHGAAWHVAVNLYGCEWDAAIDAARKRGGV